MSRRDRSEPTNKRRPGRPRAGEQVPGGSRSRLLDAAAKVFAERGYERASIEVIAEEAELSKGTVYWNFASKDELFTALLEERLDRPLSAVMEMSRTTPQEQPSSAAVSAAVADLVREQPQFFQLLAEYWAAAARNPALRKRYVARQRRLRDGLAEVLRARQPKDLPFAIEPEALATAFLALGLGLAQEALVDPDAVPDGLLGEVLSLAYDGNAARAGRLP